MTEATEKKAPAKRAGAVKVEETPLNIYQRINAISEEAGALAPEAKGGVPFAFRGIDGTVAHLTPFMHKYGVFNTSKVQSHIITEREVGNRVIKTAQVEVEFEFFAPDGSSVRMATPGLADDFADRASAQAMSVAYRIALLQLFHLPTHTREPEETGQVVQDEIAKGDSAPRAAKAVEAAKAKAGATAAAAASVTKLQAEAKALARELEKGPEDLNTLGAKLAEDRGVTNWFQDAGVMSELVEALKAEKAA